MKSERRTRSREDYITFSDGAPVHNLRMDYTWRTWNAKRETAREPPVYGGGKWKEVTGPYESFVEVVKPTGTK